MFSHHIVLWQVDEDVALEQAMKFCQLQMATAQKQVSNAVCEPTGEKRTECSCNCYVFEYFNYDNQRSPEASSSF